MKVKCISNSGKYLSQKQISLGNSKEYVREYLNIGEEYIVYGVMLVRDTLNYLISIKPNNSPFFEPVEFFEILDHEISPLWFYNYFGEEIVESIVGYKELALDRSHNVGLVERKGEDLKVFYMRKNEIDQWEQTKNEQV